MARHEKKTKAKKIKDTRTTETLNVCADDKNVDQDEDATERDLMLHGLRGGSFKLAPGDPIMSASGRKRIYRGTYTHEGHQGGRSVTALAMFFVSGTQQTLYSSDGKELTDEEIQALRTDEYAREIRGLSASRALGVGPALIEGGIHGELPDGTRPKELFPLLIEEDAGVSLTFALMGAPIPCDGADGKGKRIADFNEEEKRVLSAKIAFDIVSQVANIHAAGLFHRDIRRDNIALRLHGDGSDPSAVRATLLDFDCLTDRPRDFVREPSYYDPLFGNGNWEGSPTPLEQDAGYLSIVLAEVSSLANFAALHGEGCSMDDVVANGTTPIAESLRALTGHPRAFFCHEDRFARLVTHDDAVPYARVAGLRTVVEEYGSVSDGAVEIALEIAGHSGYLDICDIENIERSPRMTLERQVRERLSRKIWEYYNQKQIDDGKEPEYKHFEDQPEDLQTSCMEQASSIRQRAEELGYRLVLLDECPADKRITALNDRQIEFVAEQEHIRWCEERTRKGYSYADLPKTDHEDRKSPYLLPWSAFVGEKEHMKENDLNTARTYIELLEFAGLALRRP